MDAVSCLPPASFHFTTTMSSDSAASSSSPTLSHPHHHWLADLVPPPPSLSFAPRPHPHPHPHPHPQPRGLTAARDDQDSVSAAMPTPPRVSGRRQLPPGAGRAGKRRSRASKRAPTTYITTDPANFRLMVQHITGADTAADGIDTASNAADGAGGYYGNLPLLPSSSGTAGDEASAAALVHHQQLQQQQPCFPTLDSWNVSMYDSRDDLL